MRIAHRDSAPTRGKSDHRPGGIGFIALLQGEPGSIDNFDLSISITTDDFHTPRHRHNFDQVRYILKGEFSFDRDRSQREGQLGYFCEGTYYQQQGVGATETFLLQCAGASGSGYMSFDQLYATARSLTQKGQFEDGVYTWRDSNGKKHNVDGYQAVWEEVNQRRLEYPKPRYDAAVLLNNENFAWLPLAGSSGVEVRELGQFNERGLAVGEARMAAGARYEVSGTPSRNLLFVLDGEGSANGEALRTHSAVQVERSETVVIAARTPMMLMRLRLPHFEAAIAA
jgi:hypothetical protein